MALIKIYQGRSKNTKKKPGWQKEQEEYKEWEAKINSMSLFGKKSLSKKPSKIINPVVTGTTVDPTRLQKPKSLDTGAKACTKTERRPDIIYRDNPEFFDREIKARERKFTSAPIYNKGNAVLITDEMMKDIKAGSTRRRT